MRLLGVAGVLGALLAAVPAADARMHHPARGHRIVASVVAPLDAFTVPSGAYSFRKLKSTYSGPALRIRRASDSLELDISFLGCTGFTGCPWDEAAAVAHCAATTCFIRTWHDQSGAARHLVQATAVNQPQLIFSCIGGSLPCVRLTTGLTQELVSSSYTPATGVVSLSLVSQRSTGSGACRALGAIAGAAGTRLQYRSAAVGYSLVGGVSGTIVTGGTEAAPHSVQAVVSGASSSVTVDGAAAVTGTVAGTTVAGGIGMAGVAATSCDIGEGVVWDNYVLAAGEIAALTANQRSFWGTP